MKNRLFVLLILLAACLLFFRRWPQAEEEVVSFAAFRNDEILFPDAEADLSGNTETRLSGDAAAALSPGLSRGNEYDWVVYWYLCGSDLETEYGCATDDLAEILSVSLPEGVCVVVETGGAVRWHNDQVRADVIQRWLCHSGGLSLLEELPQADMGDAETLTDFLRFCRDNYPARQTAAVFWDHGGGTVSGTAFDENYEDDSLTLHELRDAFAQVWTLSADAPPLDLIGFDACMMATVDVAAAFADISRYLAASEEMVPGSGWDYTALLGTLAADPSTDAQTLGTVLCDSYLTGCERAGEAEEATFSLTDLGRTGPLLDAYERFGRAILGRTLENPDFLPEFGRAASRAENYGGNNPEEGYFNLVDLGDLARNCTALVPDEADTVLRELETCVLYHVSGPYRAAASGLSCYYSYDGDASDLDGYREEGIGTAFKTLYTYELGGTLDEQSAAYIREMGYSPEDLPPVPAILAEEEYPVYVDSGGVAVLDVGPETAAKLTDVCFLLFYLDTEEDTMLLLGRDNDLYADWENGVFRDNFWGVWGAIDEHLVYMELVYEGEDYNAYSVPVLLNGEEYHLRVIYDYNSDAYRIAGARRGLDEQNGMADRNLRQLQPGDRLTTIHYLASLEGEDDFVPYEAETFFVTRYTAFTDINMGDGEFLLRFELTDVRNGSAYSQPVRFTVEEDSIYAEVDE